MTSGTGSSLPKERLSFSRRGFSLMEVIMVLAVIAMVVGLAIAMFVMADEDNGLKGPPEDLARMTKQASRSAVVLGRPVVIAFGKEGFTLIGGDGDASVLPEGMKVKYQRWNSGRRWYDTDNLNWTFFPSGICDALRFRFEGTKEVTEIAFHPLTGSITEQLVLAR